METPNQQFLPLSSTTFSIREGGHKLTRNVIKNLTGNEGDYKLNIKFKFKISSNFLRIMKLFQNLAKSYATWNVLCIIIRPHLFATRTFHISWDHITYLRLAVEVEASPEHVYENVN